MPNANGAFLRELVARRGWHVSEFIQAMVNTGEVVPGVLRESSVRRWFVDGPPRKGRAHRAMLRALEIGSDSPEWHRLIGQGGRSGSDLIAWLRRRAVLSARIHVEPVGSRGIQGLAAPAEGGLLCLDLGSHVRLKLRLDQPVHSLILNHSHTDDAIDVLFPSTVEPDAHLRPENGVAFLPRQVASAYPVNGPKGKNDLYVVMAEAPITVGVPWLTTMATRALTAHEADLLGQALGLAEHMIAEVGHVAYCVD